MEWFCQFCQFLIFTESKSKITFQKDIFHNLFLKKYSTYQELCIWSTLCGGFVTTDFIDILWSYFSGIGAIIFLHPSAGEIALLVNITSIFIKFSGYAKNDTRNNCLEDGGIADYFPDIWNFFILVLQITIWGPSQYKDRLIYVWRFPC